MSGVRTADVFTQQQRLQLCRMLQKAQVLHAANGTSHLAPCASWPGSRPHPARHLHPPLLPPGRPPEPHWLWAPQCLQGSQPAQVSDQHLQDCTCTRRAAGMAHGRPGAAAFWGRNLNPRIVCGAPFSTGGCMPAAASAALKSDASVTSSGIAAWRQSSPSAQGSGMVLRSTVSE